MSAFEFAKEWYKAQGVDVCAAMDAVAKIPVSMHCWQGDDVMGFEGDSMGASGGILTTGNYPGRARNAAELRADIEKALSLIPGTKKVNLHANYAELNGKKIDRDAYTIDEFTGWVDWAKANNVGLDFNTTNFSHPMAASGFTLSSPDEKVRKFWIEHGKRCREIGEEFGKRLGKTCVINHWMPDGYKDVPEDTVGPRARMVAALDEIFNAKEISEEYLLDGVESKVFGIGVESYTVGSHELMMGYALSRNKMYTLDAGHFHPTEKISDKIGAILQFMPRVLLHVSRGIRWDSDHVVALDDELQAIMNEVATNNYQDRVCIALDYFDASLNRVAAWGIGMRNAQKALLRAFLRPANIREAEYAGDYTARLAMQEAYKVAPFSAIWDEYCQRQNAPIETEWFKQVQDYEKNVQFKRI
ncbi:MAG: L-rhamnose isomerase [Clostridiales bacterium]|nr:L-rhamnose isomerase [Clostridiales bacterium]